jgi:hypothetical protein
MSSLLQPCPYCREPIQRAARKCRFCLEMLPDGWNDGAAITSQPSTTAPSSSVVDSSNTVPPVGPSTFSSRPKAPATESRRPISDSVSVDARDRRRNSVTAGIGWMFGISLLLFFLPVLGPFIAGIVGGRKSGGVLNGIMAAMIPSLLFASLLLSLTSVIAGIPIIGSIATLGSIAIAFAGGGPLLLGAILGGLFAAGRNEPISMPAVVVVLLMTSLIGWRVYWQVTNTIEQINNTVAAVATFADSPSSTMQRAAQTVQQGAQAALSNLDQVRPASVGQAFDKVAIVVQNTAQRAQQSILPSQFNALTSRAVGENNSRLPPVRTSAITETPQPGEGFHAALIRDTDVDLLKGACADIRWADYSTRGRVPYCTHSDWQSWLTEQQATLIPGGMTSVCTCDRDNVSTMYIVFPDGARYLVFHNYDQDGGNHNEIFWLVNPVTRDLEAIFGEQRGTGVPQYFGNGAKALSTARVTGMWIETLRVALTR